VGPRDTRGRHAVLPSPPAATHEMLESMAPLDFQIEFPFDGRTALARPATWDDIELLRVWKNANRDAFFHRVEITPEDQRRWFAGFSQRTDAQMFILELDGVALGCVGFRFVASGSVDLFNLILGDVSTKRRGLMSAFYGTLERELAQRGVSRVQLRVLRTNAPGIAFYERHGFTRYDATDDGESFALEKALTGPHA
jgi:ribosomal protein S18 acetylase RimI-like enzyme